MVSGSLSRRQQYAAFGAHLFRDLDCAIDRRRRAADHRLAVGVVVRDRADANFPGRLGSGGGILEVEAEQCRHCPLADRHRLLHGLSAQLQQPGAIGERDSAGRRQGGIFPERVAGDQRGRRRQGEPALAFDHSQHG